MKPPSRLWSVAVELTGPRGSQIVYAIVDTGASVTLMPPEILLAIGCDPAQSQERAGILTASGTEYLAVVRVPEINALGHRIQNLEIMSHSLPSGGSADGLLGMDFLLQLPAFQKLDQQFRPFFV